MAPKSNSPRRHDHMAPKWMSPGARCTEFGGLRHPKSQTKHGYLSALMHKSMRHH